MAQGKPGADSNDLVTATVGGISLLDRAKNLFGEDPVFWGRYFKGPGNSDPVQYQAHLENAALRARNIRLLPVARQTNHVGESEGQGRADGILQTEGLLSAFDPDYLLTIGANFYYFLDVETSTPLSRGYYRGWAQALVQHSQEYTGGKVRLAPCVYLSRDDAATCEALTAAVENDGAECHGIWVARYFNHDDTGCHRLVDWDSERVQPVSKVPAPVLLWQYAGDCFGDSPGNGPIDANQVNPGIDLQNDLLSHLILPPAASVG